MSGVSTRTREVLAKRSGGKCEVCGGGKATEVHHRRPRGMGGSRKAATNLPSNLLHLCAGCHRGLIEIHREVALNAGWLVRQADDPAGVAVHLRYGTVYLGDQGEVSLARAGALGLRGRDGFG